MNANFVDIIKRITAEQGEDILANPQRVKGYVNDYAARENKVERLVFCRCIEYGAYTELKNVLDAGARQRVKVALAQKMHSNEGLDLTLCQEAIDVLEAVLFGIMSRSIPQKSVSSTETDMPVYTIRGNDYDGEKDYDRVIKNYTQVIELYPNYSLAYFNRGDAYAKKGNINLARADLRKALELDPDNALVEEYLITIK
jgi:tetratricopeptide (TPR) repeat protein